MHTGDSKLFVIAHFIVHQRRFFLWRNGNSCGIGLVWVRQIKYPLRGLGEYIKGDVWVNKPWQGHQGILQFKLLFRFNFLTANVKAEVIATVKFCHFPASVMKLGKTACIFRFLVESKRLCNCSGIILWHWPRNQSQPTLCDKCFEL